MSTDIVRPRYYESQLLGPADFIAEQEYHMRVRRVLSRTLHLNGIVYGLRLVEPLQGSLEAIFVSPGMAIDGYGREIILAQPLPITAEMLDANSVRDNTSYGLWIRYARHEQGLQNVARRTRNGKDEQTRWRESAEVVLMETSPSRNPLKPAADAPDDPEQAEWPVFLGRIEVKDKSTAEVAIDHNSDHSRQYVGIRAQSLIAPDGNRVIEATTTIHEKRNLIIGDDFSVPPAKSSDDGELKVKQAVFVEGEIYKKVGNDWLALSEYIQNFVPEVQVGTWPIPIALGAGGATNGTVLQTLTCTKTTVANVDVTAAIAGITGLNKAGLDNWSANIHDTSPWALSVEATYKSKTKLPGSGGWNIDVDVTWKLNPKDHQQPVNTLPITEIIASYVAIIHP